MFDFFDKNNPKILRTAKLTLILLSNSKKSSFLSKKTLMEHGESVLIAGGSGLVGDRLCHILTQNGYRVMILSRKKYNNGNIAVYEWDVEKGTIDENAILRADYVINLAGTGIADARWTDARKKLIIESRVKSAELLLSTFKKLNHFPKVYISAAAIGFYGDRADEILDEESAAGTGFLSESCIAWENSIQTVAESGIRTVTLRIGIVLSMLGGALAETMKPLRFGLATYFGKGNQYYSWIHIDDLCNIFLKAIEDEDMVGVYNSVAPNPSTNKEFTKTLKEAYGKFSILAWTPSFLMRLVLGEMSAVVMTSSIVSSAKIEQEGFIFQYPELLTAFKDVLHRKI
jgi:uncharacterized protein